MGMIIILAWRAKKPARLIFLCEVKILKWKKQVTAAKKKTLVLTGFVSFLMIASSSQSFTSSYLTYTHTHTLWLLLKQLYDVSFPKSEGRYQSSYQSQRSQQDSFMFTLINQSLMTRFESWLVMLIIIILEMKKSVMIFKTLTVFLI